VVRLYIVHGTPVASGEVARGQGISLSSASVRNIMAGLEAAGYLFRPHSSAGCTPSDAAYRLYVDTLRPLRALPTKTRRQIERRLAATQRELVEDLEWVAQAVAEATRGAGVAVRPMIDEPSLEAASLIALDGVKVLGVLVTADGAVDKRVLTLSKRWSRPRLQELGNWLTGRLRGKTLEAIRTELGQIPDVAAGWCFGEDGEELIAALFARTEDDVEVSVAGTENLLQAPDFARVERLRSVLGVLHDRARIAHEWRRGFRGDKTQVIIGNESEVTASGNLGMVATLIFQEGRQFGAVGVVGSRRMDYGRIVPVVEFIGDSLTRMLEGDRLHHA
jgi:heat-inducible transcriptional repressor